MKNTFLIITSIAGKDNAAIQLYAKSAKQHNIPFILIGDLKNPDHFVLEGCDFYNVELQKSLDFSLSKILPYKHYARKNLGYLIAITQGAEVIIETDDDNLPFDEFWNERSLQVKAHHISKKGWVNVYKYFSKINIWPRGFALEKIQENPPALSEVELLNCPIQQGLADENPDVDAIYRLTQPLPVYFDKVNSIALGEESICPFNSQNTTWFKEAFPLLYLPSYCSFRMTDIWRSFVAQRVAWTCNWPILFHQSTVFQKRNDHNLMNDFNDEVIGYSNCSRIMEELNSIEMQNGVANISENMIKCYTRLIELNLVGHEEMALLEAWLMDI